MEGGREGGRERGEGTLATLKLSLTELVRLVYSQM